MARCLIPPPSSRVAFSLLWLIDQEQVKFFGPDGSFLGSESIDEFCQQSNLQ